MTDYAKISLVCTYSENSDYTSPEHVSNFALWELTPDEMITGIVDAVIGSGSDFLIETIATVTAVIIQNTGTDRVAVQWDDLLGTTLTMDIESGNAFAVITDVDPATPLNLTADSGTQRCKVIVLGT